MQSTTGLSPTTAQDSEQERGQSSHSHSLDLRTAIPYHSISESERKRYWDDGVHLTADGYDWMGGKIAAALIPLLGELSQTT